MKTPTSASISTRSESTPVEPTVRLPYVATSDLDVTTPQGASAGDETVLVVEDDDDVRDYTTGILRELGYKVLEAPNAAIAPHIVSGGSRIDLLYTDGGLPGGIKGKRLADAARQRRPDLRVLFTSGYARN